MEESQLKELVKLVVFVPETHADQVREAMGKAGAGKIGDYTFCSYSSKGQGRFLPGEGASPAIGKVGQLEVVAEDRVEVACERGQLKDIVAAIKVVHPYEEVALDIYPMYFLES